MKGKLQKKEEEKISVFNRCENGYRIEKSTLKNETHVLFV